MIRSEVSDEEIREAVVVVVARAHTLAPSCLGEAHALGHIAEMAVPIVVVEAVGATRSGHEENVEQAIVVVVKKRSAAAGCLEDQLFGSLSAVGHGAG